MSGELPPEEPVTVVEAERDALATEVDRLRAERDRLTAEAAVLERRVHGGRARRVAVGALVVLSCVSMLAATLAFWANRNLLETDVWVDRVGPTIEDPAVQQSISTVLTDQVVALVDPEALFESALPERGQVLAAPLALALREFVHDRVLGFVASERFHEMWTTAMERAHRASVAALRGRSGAVVDASDGTVSINVIPIVDAILARIATVSPELFGRTVDIPEITFDDLPGVARQRLADALGVELDDDFGTITIYDEEALGTVQRGVRAFDRLLPLSIALAVAAPIAALALSRRRRRTGLQVLVALALALVLARRLALRATSDIVGLVPDATNAAAVDVVLRAFLDPLLGTTGWVLIGLAAVAAVLVVTGPYPWMAATRRTVAGLAVTASSAAGDVARQDTTVAWVRRNLSALQWAGAAGLVASLWWFDLSWWGLLLVVALIGAAELLVHRTAAAADRDLDEPPVVAGG